MEAAEQQLLPRVAAIKPQRRPVPDHPPYAKMVGVAVRALAEPGGSSERSISNFIVSSFSGLPPGHDKLLPFYLRKLVSSGYLCVPSSGRYLLSDEPNPKSHPHYPRRLGEASSAPRRRGRPPKKSDAAVLPEEHQPSHGRRPRGRPRKHPILSPSRDKVVQRRKLVVRLRTKPPDGSPVGSAPTDVACKVTASNEKEESWRPRSQRSPEDAPCVFNAISLQLLSLNKAGGEPLLLDPLEELVWGLPMQPEPEAELWLPLIAAEAGKPKPTVELFNDKAAERRLPSDLAMVLLQQKPAMSTVERCNQKAEGIPHQELDKESEGQVVSITLPGTVEEELLYSVPVTNAELINHQELDQETDDQVMVSITLWSTVEQQLLSSIPVLTSEKKKVFPHGEQRCESTTDGKLNQDECPEMKQQETSAEPKELQPLSGDLYFGRQQHQQTEGELLLVDISNKQHVDSRLSCPTASAGPECITE